MSLETHCHLRVLVRSWAPFLAALVAGNVGAASRDYVLELPANQTIAYKIEFQVDYPGPIVLEADWTGTRVLSFRLEPPQGSLPRTRRSGPPPQRLELAVDETHLGAPGVWKLSIRGLPLREAAQATMTLHLPDPATAIEPDSPAAAPEVESETIQSWMRPRTAPDRLGPEWSGLYAATERFRAELVEQSRRDRYAWQDELLRYLADRRDGTSTLPDETTRRMLVRSALAVRRVSRLAETEDPLVVGPAPEDGLQRRAWLMLREDRIAPLEHELDSMLHEIHRGDVPGLAEQRWFGRFLSCLMACERHFEARGRVGDEEALNADVVAEQWDRLKLAADALESLASLP